MNIGEDGVKEEDGVMFHENIDNYIKTDIVKEEPKEADFPIKCEICNKNSDTEKVCKHHKNDRPGNVEDDKLQESCLFPGNNLQKISDVRTKIESTDCGISQKHEDTIIKLIDADITIKKEEYLDNPEYLSMNIDLVESQTEYVKTEDDVDDIFHENDKIAKFKEEPTDNEPTLSSDILVKDEISFVDVKLDISEDSEEGFKRIIQTDHNNFTTDEVPKKYCSNAAEKPHRCTICQKTFSWNSQLIVHERTHTGERPFQCETCLRKFYSNGQLTEHRKRHAKERTYQCAFCSKSFISKSRLVIHGRTHTGERPFQCTLCSRSFIQLNYLNAHKRIHDVQNPYTCKVCLKSFPDNSSFTTHSRIHTGERPFQCRYCSKYFTYRCNVVSHEKIHSGEKPYVCEVCSKSFIRRGELIMHERIHNGERPYKCEGCPKSYSSKSALFKHKKTHAEGKK